MQAQTVVGVRGSSANSFGTLVPSTGAFTVVGATGASFSCGDLAWDNDTSTLYAGGASNTGLYRINTSTGAATLIGTHGLTGLTGLTWDYTNTSLYAFNYLGGSQNGLYSINPTTGAAALIGPKNGVSISDLAYDSKRDVVYGASLTDLYSFNLVTGALTQVFHFTSGIIADSPSMTYVASSDSLYIFDYAFNMASINLSTWTMTDLGNAPLVARVHAIESLDGPVASVPEPASVAIWLGLAVLLGAGFRRRSR